VVGIWNTKRRFEEYMPQRAAQGDLDIGVLRIPDLKAGDLRSDRYVAFLVGELKPFIDGRYRTLPGRADTFVMGSSMGALVSEYAMSVHPEVFGGAGCVSTHWPAGDGMALDDFAAHLPDPATHRYYFDYGTETLDAEYEPYQLRADEILRKAGYVAGTNWITRKFPGAEHSEKAWRLLVLLTLPATAMGFALCVQISALSWILATKYGLEIHDIGLVWAAGPLAGIVGQVLIDIMSDDMWFWGGRRRPFLIVGGTLAALMLLALPSIGVISSRLGFDGVLGVAIAVAIALDLSINVSFNPARSLITDLTPEGVIKLSLGPKKHVLLKPV